MAYSLIVLLNFIKMLHEVLFALLGFTGSIFRQVPDERTFSNRKYSRFLYLNLAGNDGNPDLDLDASMNGPNRDLRFCVNTGIDFLSKAEIELLNQLI